MLIANSFTNDKQYALFIGANNYVTKPFHTKELVALVKATIKN